MISVKLWKLKGMRWRTFERLSAEHDAFVAQALAAMAQRLGILDGWRG
ncbi:hypothetical protein EV699_10342 [Plasticicumulans lactativorans]|uniref:Transposase n=2 Tax=Plasticicumulans lactativorans TaxID=1133106 RepID=A0A4V6NPL3_9GAMM|nr:hypothetical protein EV699_10342 [Plasticicumulans lactativorans]